MAEVPLNDEFPETDQVMTRLFLYGRIEQSTAILLQVRRNGIDGNFAASNVTAVMASLDRHSGSSRILDF